MNRALAIVGRFLQEAPDEPNVPNPQPDPSGMPGQAAIETGLDIVSWLGVVAAVGAVIVGGAFFAFGHGAAHSMSSGSGKTMILAGLGGGLIIALAGQLVSFVIGLA